MLCENAGLLLVDYQHNRLAPTEHAALSLHLQQCEHCRAELVTLQQLNLLLDREEQPSPLARARFTAQLQQAASRSNSASRPGFALWLQSWWSARPFGAFSYSAALLVAGILSGQSLPPHSLGIGPQPPLAERNLSSERLIQLCAVPAPPNSALL
jgi:anti-sigma factor RsiW